MKVYFSLCETMYNDNIYLLLYKKIYNKTNISVLHENVFLIIRDDI